MKSIAAIYFLLCFDCWGIFAHPEHYKIGKVSFDFIYFLMSSRYGNLNCDSLNEFWKKLSPQKYNQRFDEQEQKIIYL